VNSRGKPRGQRREYLIQRADSPRKIRLERLTMPEIDGGMFSVLSRITIFVTSHCLMSFTVKLFHILKIGLFIIAYSISSVRKSVSISVWLTSSLDEKKGKAAQKEALICSIQSS
jgi:hypothetical protein